MDPQRFGPDHIGFKVEGIQALEENQEDLTGQNPLMRTRPLGFGDEGTARLSLFQSVPLNSYHLTDIEGVYIGVSEE